MKRWLFLALLALLVFCSGAWTACGSPPAPNPPPTPASQGGAVGAGGAATGGAIETGGAAATGGVTGTGGAISAGGGPVVQDWPECAAPTAKAKPVVRHALGRLHTATQARAVPDLRVLDVPDAAWPPLFASLDQSELGACTGFATLQCRLSALWAWGGVQDVEQLNLLARSIYSGATRRDPWLGSWPPDDTGSGGQWALDEAVAQGIFAGYLEVTSFADLQLALQKGPCITGTDWYDGMFAPDRCGVVKKTGTVQGGHEWTIEGIRHSTKQLLGRTSWGNDFGARWRGKGGFFWISYEDYRALLDAGGDVHCPRVGPGNDNARRLREAG